MVFSAEIICVGTELLLGNIINGNAQFLAQQLARLGIPHYYQTVVGDNPDRLKKVLAIAADRARLLIFTGGLGPTPDDLTTETIAEFFAAPLVEHPEILADMERKFAQRGRPMPTNNHKQAWLPAGAEVLPNPVGSAPGMIWQPRTGLTILTFPGVPTEMQRMWHETATPYLQSLGWGQSVIYSRTLKYWGISESALVEKIGPLLETQNPTVAPYANYGQVKLRVTARAETEAAAVQMITPIEAQLRQIGGEDYYGADEETLPLVVGNLLQKSGATLAVAESCTGGGLGAMITSIAGSSGHFVGGVISYDNQIKTSVLGVDPGLLQQDGAVSALVAQQMAAGVRNLLKSSWGLSITGIAGPGGGTPAKPVGLVYVGIAEPNGSVKNFRYQFGSTRDREWIRHVSACTALDQLRRHLMQPV